MRYFYLSSLALSLSFLVLSCNNNSNETKLTDSTDSNLVYDSIETDTLLETIKEIEKSKESDYWEKFYVSAINKDSVKMHLIKTSSEIKGELKFIPLMKDRRLGTLSEGVMIGDTLYAKYDSMQEGQRNICEIAFLKVGENFILSNDMFSEQNYTFNKNYTIGKFKNKSKITFNGVLLKEIPHPAK